MFGKNKFGNREFCPLVKGYCIKDQCVFWHKVTGQVPIKVDGKQELKDVDQEDCTFNWLMIGQFEMAKQQRSNTAATESFRNEYVAFNQAFAQMVNDGLKRTRGPALEDHRQQNKDD